VGDVVGGGARRGTRATGVATGGGAPGGSFMGAGDASCSVRGSFTDADGRESEWERDRRDLHVGPAQTWATESVIPLHSIPQTKQGMEPFHSYRASVEFHLLDLVITHLFKIQSTNRKKGLGA